MKYTKKQYQEMAAKFNNMSFTNKLKTLKEQKEVFKFEYDNGWCMVGFKDIEDEDLREELNDLIGFDGEAFVDNSNLIDLFVLAGIY